MILIFDTATNGLPIDYSAPPQNVQNWPRIVALGWQLFDASQRQQECEHHLIVPRGFRIPKSARDVHGISLERAKVEGRPIEHVLRWFNECAEQATVVAAFNLAFHENTLIAEFIRNGMRPSFATSNRVCISDSARRSGLFTEGRGIWTRPTLPELYDGLFRTSAPESDGPGLDTTAGARCFFELQRLGKIPQSE